MPQLNDYPINLFFPKFDKTFKNTLNTPLTFKIYTETANLPKGWNELATNNIFLTLEYLQVLEDSMPNNMICHYIGIFKEENLSAIALAQFLDLNKLESFGDRDKCIKTAIRNFVFKNFASHVLFIGNNMLTGQNAFALADEKDKKQVLQTLKLASVELRKNFKVSGLPIHLISFKDFYPEEVPDFQLPEFQNNYQFSSQPNMVFNIDPSWKSDQDYINALTKKYRDQYKRARKKAEGLEKRKMHLQEIIDQEETIYDLYHHVAKNAPFNTFFLAKNHFSTFKKLLKDRFLFYGYFLDGKLIGFNTLIKNGEAMDTYFLGYDDSIQRYKMLYLNMLYDIIAYSINKGFKEVIFARTALEIKSSVGAKPIQMAGYIEHANPLLNRFMKKVFDYLEPETVWKERSPFKE